MDEHATTVVRGMTRGRTRREVLVAGLGLVAAACTGSDAAPVASGAATSVLAEIEARIGGRLGVFALDTASGRSLAHRADERFAMCSTFKWVVAAAVLARLDRSELSLDERIPYGASDLLEHAPFARAHVAEGAATIDALARAAITISDNTAANLLLPKVGGPAGLTAWIREHGDAVTRLDRDEPSLNENAPGDPRDTTSPRAMVGLMREVLCGDALAPTSRAHLLDWLRACESGNDRLRAGLPEGWAIGHKTGSCLRSAINDVAILWPPGDRAPVLVAAYTSDGESGLRTLEAALADVGRLVAREL